MDDLNGKTAFITGGASGIGLGMALAFLEQGMKVVIADIREDHLAEAAEMIGAQDEVLFLPLDVTDRAAMAEAADAVVRRFGKVHILCNNAGVGLISDPLTTSYDDWDWSRSVNLDSVFNGLHCFLPLIRSHGEGGHVVNTSSIAAMLPGGFTYAAAKAAVCGLTESMAEDLAQHNIGATCLMPGPVKSNIHEVGLLRPAEFSDTNAGEKERDMASRSTPDHWLEPIEVGRMVVDAIRRNALFLFTHKEFRDGVAERFEAILAAIPAGDSSEEEKQRIGFPTSKPVYEKQIAIAAARGRNQA